MRERDWASTYSEWRGSGQTQAHFCKEKKVNLWKFRNKIKELELSQKAGTMQRATDVGSADKSLRDQNGAVKGSNPFVTVRLKPEGNPASAAPWCEIRFGCGKGIRIDGVEAVRELGNLLRSLKNA